MLERDRTVLSAIHTFIHNWNEPCLPTLQPQSVTGLWLVFIFRPAEDRRLSWPDIVASHLCAICANDVVTLSLDGCTVTFGTAKRTLDGYSSAYASLNDLQFLSTA